MLNGADVVSTITLQAKIDTILTTIELKANGYLESACGFRRTDRKRRGFHKRK
jgi:hypothetical protein